MIVTLNERRHRSRLRLADAAGKAIDALRQYASTHGGRYVVFGSIATGRYRDDSDLDLVVDFPPPGQKAAWDFAEDLCGRLGLRVDIVPKDWVSPELADRVARDGLVLA